MRTRLELELDVVLNKIVFSWRLNEVSFWMSYGKLFQTETAECWKDAMTVHVLVTVINYKSEDYTQAKKMAVNLTNNEGDLNVTAYNLKLLI